MQQVKSNQFNKTRFSKQNKATPGSLQKGKREIMCQVKRPGLKYPVSVVLSSSWEGADPWQAFWGAGPGMGGGSLEQRFPTMQRLCMRSKHVSFNKVKIKCLEKLGCSLAEGLLKMADLVLNSLGEQGDCFPVSFLPLYDWMLWGNCSIFGFSFLKPARKLLWEAEKGRHSALSFLKENSVIPTSGPSL